jgi:hypothetical protein
MNESPIQKIKRILKEKEFQINNLEKEICNHWHDRKR